MRLVTFSDITNIPVEIFLLRDSNSNVSENTLIAEDYSSDAETQRHVREILKARNLALKDMLECPLTNDRNDRDTRP